MFQVFDNSKKVISDTVFKGKMEDSHSYYNAETRQSLFSLLKEFNDFSQSIYDKTLIKAGLDHDSHLILQNICSEKPINLAQMLIATGLSYVNLRLLLENLESSQFITISGSKSDPASILLALTDEGIILLEKIQQRVNLAERDVLRNLPQSGVHLKNILIDCSEETPALEQHIQLFDDDLVTDETSKVDNIVHDENKTKIIPEMGGLDHNLENFKLTDDQLATSEEVSVEDTPIIESKIQKILNEIRNVAVKQYPDSYSSQLYQIEEEFNAYLKIEELDLGNISRNIFEKIRACSLEKEGYEEQLYMIEKETDAYFRLQNLSRAPVPLSIFDGICKSIKKEYPDSYSDQLYHIEDKIFSYAEIGNLFSVPEKTMNKIHDFVATEYSDSEYRNSEIKDQIRAYFNLQFRLDVSDIPDNVMQKINQEAEKYYSDNLEEYFHEVSRQISSFGKLKSLATKRVPSNFFKKIKEYAAEIYDNDFSSQMDKIEEGIRSYCKIVNFPALGISEKKLNKIKGKAKKVDGDDYSWQLDEIENQVSAYYKKKNAKKLPSDIRKKINKIASKDYKNDYFEQESEVKRQVRDYWKVLELTPELFFIEFREPLSDKRDDLKVTVVKKEVAFLEEKETRLNSIGEEQVAIPSVLIDDKISNLEDGYIAVENQKTPEIKVTELKKWVLRSLTKNEGIISLKEVCEVAFGTCRDKPESTQLRQLAQKLSAEKIGISPDPKFAFKQQEFSDCGVLFNLSFSAKTVEQEKVSDHYKIAYLMLHLGMKAAQSDDIIVDAETDIIQKIVMKNPGLSASEKSRLQADMKRLIQSKISLEFMASMLKDLSSKHKEGVAHLAFRVVASDNIIETSELNFLLWLYEQLGFNHEKVQQKIKMIGDLPKTITKNFPEQMLTNILGYKVTPEEPQQQELNTKIKLGTIVEPALSQDERVAHLESSETKTDTLNVQRISDLREESDASAELLHELFSQDQGENNLFDDIHTEVFLEERQITENNSVLSLKIEGMDEQHQELFLTLFESKNNDWNWFVMLARGCGLMASGAVETLNEWGYEHYGEALIEYDPFQINRSYFEDIFDLASAVHTKNYEDHADESEKEDHHAESPTAEDVLEQEKKRNTHFLNAVLAEQKIDQERFEEIAVSYGLTYEEAFELLQ